MKVRLCHHHTFIIFSTYLKSLLATSLTLASSLLIVATHHFYVTLNVIVNTSLSYHFCPIDGYHGYHYSDYHHQHSHTVVIMIIINTPLYITTVPLLIKGS